MSGADSCRAIMLKKKRRQVKGPDSFAPGAAELWERLDSLAACRCGQFRLLICPAGPLSLEFAVTAIWEIPDIV